MLMCYLSYCSQVIDSASVDRTSTADNSNGLFTRPAIFCYRVPERSNIHPEIGPHWNQAQILAAKPQHGQSLWDCHVNFGRGINNSWLGSGVVGGQLRFARHGKAHQIGSGAPTAEAATKPFAADDISNPANDRLLNGNAAGRRPPCRLIVIDHGSKQVSDCANRIAGAEHISEETARW